MRFYKFLFLAFCVPGACSSVLCSSQPPYGFHRGWAAVVFDFCAGAAAASCNTDKYAIRENELLGDLSMPAVFLHPGREPAALSYPPVTLPVAENGKQLLFLCFVGFRRGVPWEGRGNLKPDGAVFSVWAGGERLFRIRHKGNQPRFCAVNVSHMGGKKVGFRLVVESGGSTNWDWALFGRPLLCLLSECGGEIPWNGKAWKFDLKTGGPVVVGARSGEGPGASALLFTGDLIVPRLARGGNCAQFAFIDPSWLPQELCFGPGKAKEFCLWRFRGDLVLEGLAATSAVLVSGGKTRFAVRLRNRGLGIQPEGALIHVKGPFGSVTVGAPSVEPGETRVVRTGPIELGNPGSFSVTASLGRRKISRTFLIKPPGDCKATLPGSTTLLRFLGADSVERAEVRTTEGELFAYLSPLATLKLEGSGEQAILFSEIEKHTGGVVLKSAWKELLGGAKVRVRLEVRAQGDRFAWKAELLPRGNAEAVHFGGPFLKFLGGSKDFGIDFGLLPGVEYLEAGEGSSSTLVADPPYNDHRVPHPLYLTAQSAVLCRGKNLAALLWDRGREWYEGCSDPLLYFNVPPPGGGRSYAGCQLFAPSVAQGVRENTRYAERPFRFDKPIRLCGVFVFADTRSPSLPQIGCSGRKGALVLRPLELFYRLVDPIEPAPAPRTWLQQKRLSRTAWLKSVFVPGKGMRHCAGERWPPVPTPGFLLLLYFDAVETGGAEGSRLLRRVAELTREATVRLGPGHLASRINCHILGGEYPFYVGNLKAGLKVWRSGCAAVARMLDDQGGQPWFPGNDRRKKRLGKPGQVTVGNTARSALLLAYYARVTGEEVFVQKAQKALKRVASFTVPRGAQGWECPLASPDILASGYAVRAFVEMYRITRDPFYLREARYWAWTGLPFVYAWSAPSIPSMEGNTIPIFGATFFTHTWIGVPVVWCGLVYAYGLRQLAQVDPDPRWKKVAQAITRSAELQQYTKPGPYQGCYPDSFNLKLKKRFPAAISPEALMVNAWAERGLDPGIKTVIVNWEGGRVHVSSGAGIESVEPEPGRLTVVLRRFPPPGRGLKQVPGFAGPGAVYVFAGPLPALSEIRAGGVPLKELPSLGSAPQGYCRIDLPQGVVLKARAGLGGRVRLDFLR